MAGVPHFYWRWASWAAPALLALWLLPTPGAQASALEAPQFDLSFDLSVVRSRSLPWQRSLPVPEHEEPALSESEQVQGVEHPFLEFTIEESNAAIALFGCDCPAHLNQLRRLRGLPLL